MYTDSCCGKALQEASCSGIAHLRWGHLFYPKRTWRLGLPLLIPESQISFFGLSIAISTRCLQVKNLRVLSMRKSRGWLGAIINRDLTKPRFISSNLSAFTIGSYVSMGESTTIKRLHQAFWGKAILFARAGQLWGTQLLLSEPLQKPRFPAI